MDPNPPTGQIAHVPQNQLKQTRRNMPGDQKQTAKH